MPPPPWPPPPPPPPPPPCAIAGGPEASPITMLDPRTIRQNAARVDRTNVVFMSRPPYVYGLSRLHGLGPSPWVPAGRSRRPSSPIIRCYGRVPVRYCWFLYKISSEMRA